MGLLGRLPLFLFCVFMMPAYADTFDVDGHDVVVYHRDIKDFDYPSPSGLWYYNMTFARPTSDPVVIKFPNTLPMLDNLGFGFRWLANYLDSPPDRLAEYEGECFRTHVISPGAERSEIVVDALSVATGRWEPVSYAVESFCNQIYQNPPPPKDCPQGMQNHINLRGQSVCVASVKQLTDRGYLV